MTRGRLAVIAELLAGRCGVEWSRGRLVTVGRLTELMDEVQPGLSSSQKMTLAFELLPDRVWSEVARDTNLVRSPACSWGLAA